MACMNVIVIDDEEGMREGMRRVLERSSFQVDLAENGEEAIKLLEENTYDLALIDLKMPGIDGFEVLKRVKQEHPDVEVIVLTGHGSEHDEKVVRDLGAFEYLQKPVDIATLAEKIRQAREKNQG